MTPKGLVLDVRFFLRLLAFPDTKTKDKKRTSMEYIMLMSVDFIFILENGIFIWTLNFFIFH